MLQLLFFCDAVGYSIMYINIYMNKVYSCFSSSLLPLFFGKPPFLTENLGNVGQSPENFSNFSKIKWNHRKSPEILKNSISSHLLPFEYYFLLFIKLLFFIVKFQFFNYRKIQNIVRKYKNFLNFQYKM